MGQIGGAACGLQGTGAVERGTQEGFGRDIEQRGMYAGQRFDMPSQVQAAVGKFQMAVLLPCSNVFVVMRIV